MSRVLNDLVLSGPYSEEARALFQRVGCVDETAIIEHGCTGLVAKSGLREAHNARCALEGSGCGLTCYVPSDRFCLVHNTIGGLQRGQDLHYPEGISGCSRELTAEERAHVGQMAKAIAQPNEQGASEVLAGHDEPEQDTRGEEVERVESPHSLHDRFHCPEHAQPIWKCRYCLAAAIIHGPFEPYVEIDRAGHGKSAVGEPFESSVLETALADTELSEVALYVRVARWTRKLVRDEE